MKTVLIVDDNATDRELMGRAVGATGHLPAYAVDGEDCLAQARSAKPALILLDVVMPRLDGFATCRKLKLDAALAGIPVVFVTNKGQPSDKVWGQRQGAAGHLVKPFTPQQIADTVRAFIS